MTPKTGVFAPGLLARISHPLAIAVLLGGRLGCLPIAFAPGRR